MMLKSDEPLDQDVQFGGAVRRLICVSITTVAMAFTIHPGAPATAAGAVHEIEVTAKKFAFEPSLIQVVAGERVRLVLRSSDAVHSFAIRALNIDVKIPRGGTVATSEFVAPPAGRYEVSCSEFCGSGHSQMKAALVSTPPNSTPTSTR
jgi:cytochrome c oxidase subunit 2